MNLRVQFQSQSQASIEEITESLPPDLPVHKNDFWYREQHNAEVLLTQTLTRHICFWTGYVVT